MARDHFRRSRKLASAKELVERVVSAHRIAEDMREVELFANWSSLVGDRVGAQTRPVTIYDRVLVVEVASSPWLHELRLLRPKIVSDLLDRLGLPRFFDDIRLVLAGDRRAKPPAPKPTSGVRRPVKKRPRVVSPANPVAREQIQRETSRVEDPDLRDLIARVRIDHDK